MRIVRDRHPIPLQAKGCAIAIGNFDGFHKGHQAVVNAVLRYKDARQTPVGIVTFEPHPRMFFKKSPEPFRLEPFHVKARRFKALGIDYLFALRFNAVLAGMRAEDFIDDVLHEGLQAQHVATGANFMFGHRRGGSASMLEEHSKRGEFTYEAAGPVKEEGLVCSSSAVRDALRNCNPVLARHLLGRAYEMTGRVQRGEQRGRALGFPTANIDPGLVFSPAYGIYAVRFAVADLLDYAVAAAWHDGVASWGIRPMYQTNRPLLEVHGFDMDQDVYGKHLRVQLVSYLRPEQRFHSEPELAAQIARDCEAARKALAS